MDYPIVEIIWHDAECDPAWKTVDVLIEGKLPVVYTIGYLLYEDKEKYLVASTIGGDEATSVIAIPADWVTKVSLITF